jgi:hypothetical protein
MSTIDTLIDEIQASVMRSASPWEGFKDLQRAMIPTDGDEARAFAAEAVQKYTVRDRLSLAALQALEALRDDGYPVDLSFVTDGEVRATILAQQATVNAAVGTISTPGEANTADVVIGSPVVR